MMKFQSKSTRSKPFNAQPKTLQQKASALIVKTAVKGLRSQFGGLPKLPKLFR
jgi:hypothetical protein